MDIRRVCITVLACVVGAVISIPSRAQETPQEVPPVRPDAPPAQESADALHAGPAIEPVLTLGTSIPGLPGRKVAAIERAIPLAENATVFWVRIGANDHDLAVVGLRGGALETIAVDDRCTPCDGGGSSTFLCIRLTAHESGRPMTNVLATTRQIYLGDPLSAFSKLVKVGFPGTTCRVWSWGAAGLAKVLGPGDQFAFGGKTWSVEGAGLLDANPAGTALLSFGTSAPGKALGLALCDQGGVRPLTIEGEPLPGRPTARLNDSKLVNFAVDFAEAVLAEDGGVLFRFYADEGGKKRQGLWYLSETGSHPLLQEKEPFEGSPIRRMAPVAAQSADRYVVWVEVRGGVGYYPQGVYLCSDGSCYNIAQDLKLGIGIGPGTIRDTWYPSPTSPALVFSIRVDSQAQSQSYSVPGMTWITQYKGQWLALFDGKKLWGFGTPEGFVPLAVQAAPPALARSGLVVLGTARVGSQALPASLLLDPEIPEKGLMMVSSVLEAGDAVVGLNQMVALETREQALVLLPASKRGNMEWPGGVYRVRGLRTPPTP